MREPRLNRCSWPRRWFRIAVILVSVATATIAFLACGSEPQPQPQPEADVAVALAVGPLRARIEAGAPVAVSAPAAFELTTGWKQPGVIELENRDAVRRECSLTAAAPDRIVFPEPRIVLEPNQTRTVPFLLQTLTGDTHEVRLRVEAGGRKCVLRISLQPRMDPAGVSFGALDHFEYAGPISAVPAAARGRIAGPAGRADKDVSRLTVAPTGAIADRVREAMTPIRDLGALTYRQDVSWAIVEHTPGAFAWDRMDWLIDTLRSPDGAGARIVAQIGYQPQWLPADFPATADGRERHARWVEAVVTRYADRVDCWELWNEPLLFWLRHKPERGQSPRAPLSAPEIDALAVSNSRLIMEIVRTASGIIRQRDPQATILSPGFEDFFNMPGGVFPELALQTYTRLLTDGLAQQVDGFCIHSYPAGFPGTAPRLDDPQRWREFDQTADTSRLARWLAQHNVRLPLYCTEFGGFRLPRNAGPEAETAAALAVLRNGCILAHQGFRLVTYYQLYDWNEQAPTGLLRFKDRDRTRGYAAYRELIAALTGAVACEVGALPRARIHDSDYRDLVIKAFRRGSEDILCLWNNAAVARTVRLREKSPTTGAAPIWEHVRFATAGEFITERRWRGAGTGDRAVEVTVAPLEFHILSRTGSDRGFDWLDQAEVTPPTAESPVPGA